MASAKRPDPTGAVAVRKQLAAQYDARAASMGEMQRLAQSMGPGFASTAANVGNLKDRAATFAASAKKMIKKAGN